jgi:hypothetical protein
MVRPAAAANNAAAPATNTASPPVAIANQRIDAWVVSGPLTARVRFTRAKKALQSLPIA